MAAVTWQGGATGFWDLATNWSTNPALPGAADTVTIDVAGTGTVTHQSGTDVIASLTIPGLNGGTDNLAVTGGSLTITGAYSSTTDTSISSTGTLVLNGASLLQTLTQSGGLLSGVGTVTLIGLSALSGGTQAGAGTTVAQGGVALTGTGFALDSGRVLKLQGSSTATGTGAAVDLNGFVDPINLVSDPGSGTLVVDALALFDDQTTTGGLTISATKQSGKAGDTGATALVDNRGTFRKSGAGGTSTISVTMNNSGTIDAQNGALTLSGATTNSGQLLVETGATLSLNGGSTQTGTIKAALGSTLQLAGGLQDWNIGTATVNGTLALSAGTLATGANLAFGSSGTLAISGGLLTGTSDLTVAGATTLSGGTQSGAVTTLAQGGAALSLTGGLDGGRVLELQANSTATGDTYKLDLNAGAAAGAGVLRTDVGALFDDQTATGGLIISATNRAGTDTGATALVDNKGTFRKSGTALKSSVSVAFDNSGLVDVQSGALTLSGVATNSSTFLAETGGTLKLTGGGSQTGTIQATTGSTFNLAGGLYDFNDGTATVDGTFLLSLGTMATGTDYEIGGIGTFAVSGGLLTGATTLTVAGLTAFSGGIQSGTGTTVAQGGLALSGSGAGLDGGRVLELQGTSTATGGAALNLNAGADVGSGILRIDAGALLDDQTTGGGMDIIASNKGGVDTGATALVDNRGILRKSGAAKASTISAPFSNTGTVDVQAGTMVLSGTATNAGTFLVESGASLNASGTFTNFAANTLTGGNYDVLGIMSFNGANIVVNAGAIVLDGLNSKILNNTALADALAGFTTNDAAGGFTIRDGRNFTTPGAFSNAGVVQVGPSSVFGTSGIFTNSGSLQLRGGTFNATALTNSGETDGFGSVVPAIANTGTVRASGGTLAPSAAITGTTGRIQVDADGVLQLAASSTVGALVNNGTAAGGLALGVNSITVSSGYDNANFGVGNAFDRRAHVTGTGQILAAGGVAAPQSLAGDIGATTTADAVLALGAIHVGASITKNYQVGDLAVAGPSLRGAIQTAVNGANLTDARLSGAGVTAGNFLAPAGGTTGDLAVTFTGTSDGALTGQLVHILNNFDSTNSQNLGFTGAAFDFAAPSFSSKTLDFGAARVGGTLLDQSVQLSNGTIANPFQEDLAYNVGTVAPTGGYVPVGVTAGVIASGGSQGVAFHLATDSPGDFTGSNVDVGLTSAGAGTSGLADTPLASQALTLNGKIYATATAQLDTGVLDFGIVHVGDTVSKVLGVSNTAIGALTDVLTGGFGTVSAPFNGSGTLGAGLISGAGTILTVGLDTSSAQVASGSATLSLSSHDADLTDVAVSAGPVTLTATVNNFAVATMQQTSGAGIFGQASLNYTLDFGSVLVNTGILSAHLDVANTATGPSDLLSGVFGVAGSGFGLSGFDPFSGLAAGQVDSALTVNLDTSIRGVFSETVTLTPTGSNASGFSGALAQETLTITGSVACFASGTRIATERGMVAVENQRPGDRVRTVDGKLHPITWLGHRNIDCLRHPDPTHVWPIRITAGSFGPGRPFRDLLLSPDHALFISGALIPVHYLVNGRTIRQEACAAVTYWHVEVAAHNVLYAEGVPAESYLDTGNRSAFANGGPVLDLHPDFGPQVWESQGCAPLVVCGPRLALAKRRLLARAVASGSVVTNEPALHVLANGRRLSVTTLGQRWRARLPKAIDEVGLVSRVWAPAHMHPDSDDLRTLGVAISRLWLDGRVVELDSPQFTSGWHAREPDWRWTDGDALLAVAGARELTFEVAMTGTYWMDDMSLAARAA